ncbi:benzil reductase ((S)-benzoin forming) [Methylomarinovum caldicuralii]|uniref:Benzil reductase ((S)-benzoin forming) n=1 Tax=Methylomarinovum caldicuralii TaxID=438856 RepID=A0AAU9CDV2_9GAMM|nr:SDR family NAD(P)-dependent oxidoreductase [Methylomarinovum caldicuralii]BCX81155.1 benzil reductase ((S)-benzoin forming) [Methylomarinovum caldicuralii]
MANLLITGIGSGLGKALAGYYLNRGDRVFALSRHLPDDLAGRPGLRFQPCDLQQLEAVGPALHKLLADAERLDLVILNAGVLSAIKDMTATPLYEIDWVMTVNVWANKVLLDTLIDLGLPVEQIVGISSGAAVNCNRGWNAYSLSKAGLNVLLKLYAREMAGTHLTALAPGIIWTPMLAKVVETADTEKYPSVRRIREVEKLSPEEAAERLAATFPRLKEYESGSFLDVRTL